MTKFFWVVALILFLLTPLYAAQQDYDFYKGKTINYIVATKPGGGYDAYARLIGRYMQKYVPGSTVIIRNTPGAGHIIGANETYLAKPDGLTIGTFNTGMIYSQILKQPGIRFDLTKYSWVGKADSDQGVLVVGNKAPYKTIQELISSREPVTMATSGVGSSSYTETVLTAAALGAKTMRPVPGYSGREGEMAIMRGEVTGISAAYTGVIGFVKAGECRVILQVGAKRHPDLPTVPLASELKLSPTGKSLFDLMMAANVLGRLTAAPPKVPPGRLQVLREAYRKALSDPALMQEIEKAGLHLSPGYGEEVATMMKAAINQPEENVKLLRSLIKFD
jgi:tripartite-type tricarboxylate transporter receptor subunit TctC